MKAVSMAAPPRILLVHLVANGDCLMATTIARQIKADFPGCHLTWAIGFKCRQVIENNPFVDDIWSVEYTEHERPNAEVWRRTRDEAEAKLRRGELDRVFYTQAVPDNLNNFDGTTRTSLFRSYPGRITVPIEPVMRLHPHEIEGVMAFVARHGLARYRHVVLFEAAPGSNQSPLTPTLARRVAARVTASRDDTAFIVSSHVPFQNDDPAIVDGSALSYRQNAELSRHCTLLLGGSSGITWLTTSSAGKRLPMIQFLRETSHWFSFASVKYDHLHFGLDTSHVLETTVSAEDEIVDLVQRYLEQGNFERLPRHDFRPSVEQLYDLYEMMGPSVDLGRVLLNFGERNPGSAPSLRALYFGLARRAARRQLRRAARRLVDRARRLAR
jgi:hypothetical protein